MQLLKCDWPFSDITIIFSEFWFFSFSCFIDLSSHWLRWQMPWQHWALLIAYMALPLHMVYAYFVLHWVIQQNLQKAFSYAAQSQTLTTNAQRKITIMDENIPNVSSNIILSPSSYEARLVAPWDAFESSSLIFGLITFVDSGLCDNYD